MGTTERDVSREETQHGNSEQATYTLTRRDGVVALSAGGIAAVEDSQAYWDDGAERRTLRSLATVLYPSVVELGEEFLSAYLGGRIAYDESYSEALSAGVETLDGLASGRYGTAFRRLDTDQQETLLRESDIRSGASAPAGTAVERLNYHVVDELLFALYASPTGGRVLGNTDSRGFPAVFGFLPAVIR